MARSVSSISLLERKLTLPEGDDAPFIDSRKHYKNTLKSWQKKTATCTAGLLSPRPTRHHRV